MASFKDVAPPPGRLSHLPPRPASPPRGYRYRSGDVNKPYYRPNARSPGSHQARGNEVNVAASARPRSSSPPARKHPIDTYPSELPPALRDTRDVHGTEHPRTNFRDSEVDHNVARPPAPPVVQDGGRDHALPPMHPERALMLQANGLPPRPPSALGRARSVKAFKRDRRDDRDHDRAEPLRGNSKERYRSVSPSLQRRRYPEDDHPVAYAGGSGASLLDRLSLNDGSRINLPSLRDRVQLPSKRDREDMLSSDLSFDVEGDEYDGSKRMRRRGGPRPRRGRP